MGKMTVRIFDSAFTPFSKSASLREENADIEPTYFKWVDANDHPNDGKPVFYTDNEILRRDSFEPNAVAWLLEPRCLRPENYEAAQAKAHLFRAVLSYDLELLEAIHNGRWGLIGGSSIAFHKWKIYPKKKDVCMFYSGKDSTKGHKLRHEIVKEFKGRIDFFGTGVGNPVDSKFEVLKDYRYCVVVESCRISDYFSEKLIDPISVGCRVLYSGSPNLHFPSFSLDMINFDNHNQLKTHLDYLLPLEVIDICYRRNIAKWVMQNAKKYRVAEDWIYLNHGDLFT